MKDRLVVSEVFGPTFQGEGPSAGRRAGFVRLGRCNLNCGWCDTPYSWDWARFDPSTELAEDHPSDLLNRLDSMGIDMIVVTGGEPLLQQRQLTGLLAGCRQRRWRVEVETNGTLAPTLPEGLVTQWNVSPKLANSGVPLVRRFLPSTLRAFEATGRAVFKFVVSQPRDLEEIQLMVDQCRLTDIWVMPEGTDAETLTAGLRALAEPVSARGWHLTSRLHVMVWGDRRGV